MRDINDLEVGITVTAESDACTTCLTCNENLIAASFHSCGHNSHLHSKSITISSPHLLNYRNRVTQIPSYRCASTSNDIHISFVTNLFVTDTDTVSCLSWEILSATAVDPSLMLDSLYYISLYHAQKKLIKWGRKLWEITFYYMSPSCMHVINIVFYFTNDSFSKNILIHSSSSSDTILQSGTGRFP